MPCDVILVYLFISLLCLDVFSPSEVGDYLSSDTGVSLTERPNSKQSAKLVPTARLPPNVDQLVPLSMSILISFVEKLAPKWDEIGIHLGLEDTVKVLRETPSSLTVKMAMIFERWLENDDVSWHTLLSVLKKIGYHKVASCLCEYLHKQGEYEYMYVSCGVLSSLHYHTVCKTLYSVTVHCFLSQVPELPSDIDEIVPVEMSILIKIVSKVAPYWDRIGHLLKLTDQVKGLRDSKSSDTVKMTIIFESWSERKDDSLSWEVLLSVLEKDLSLHGVSAKLREYILEKVRRTACE